MRKILAICFFLVLLFSCSEKKIVAGHMLLTPKKEIQHIIDSFVQRNIGENYLVYELYIDKLDPHNLNLFLYAGDRSLTQMENENYSQQSLMYVVSQGVKVNVYSGVERYFNNSLDERKIHDSKKKQERSPVCLAIKDSFGILNTYEIIGGYPFIPFPLENKENTFSRPIIKLE